MSTSHKALARQSRTKKGVFPLVTSTGGWNYGLLFSVPLYGGILPAKNACQDAFLTSQW
jgi:hypothetical protein